MQPDRPIQDPGATPHDRTMLRRFVERMGLEAERDGLPRIAGRILGFLITADAPASLDQIADALQVSRASVSTNCRLLEQIGAAERVSLPGDRKDYYELAPGFPERSSTSPGPVRAKVEIAEEALAGAPPRAVEPGTRIEAVAGLPRLHPGEVELEGDGSAGGSPPPVRPDRRLPPTPGRKAAHDDRFDRTRSPDRPPRGRASSPPRGAPSRPPSLFPPRRPPQRGRPLSLAEAERRALEFGEEVALVRERMAQAEDEITQVRAGALPEITANLAYTGSIRSLFDGITFGNGDDPGNGGERDNPFADLPFGRRNTWVAGGSRDPAPLRRRPGGIGLDIADKVRESLRLELAETEAEVRLQVREAYFQAAFAELLVEISDEAYALADDQLRQVEGFREQGVAAELDVLTARVERDNLEPQVVEARNAARLARLNLLRLVQLPSDTEVALTTPLEAELPAWTRRSFARPSRPGPSSEAARTRVRIEEDQVRLARAGYRPTAGAFLTWGGRPSPPPSPHRGMPPGGRTGTPGSRSPSPSSTASAPGPRSLGPLRGPAGRARAGQLGRASLSSSRASSPSSKPPSPRWRPGGDGGGGPAAGGARRAPLRRRLRHRPRALQHPAPPPAGPGERGGGPPPPRQCPCPPRAGHRGLVPLVPNA
jgi:biotin operon repressor